MVSVVGYFIVFAALIVLTYIYANIPRIINSQIRQKLKRQGKKTPAENESMDIPGEVTAAISMALVRFLEETHDVESKVMTIKQVSKRYSPWSSKIYGLNSYRR
ncbi:MAG TPA: OadG family protein [Bacteroidales bacterium]|nr:OadG family protein [Bacteroidales bacterium]